METFSKFWRLLPYWKKAGIMLSAVVLCSIAVCTVADAQSGAGSIQGTVTDTTGAVIPDAKIHVVNNATGVATDTKSNNVGFYEAPDLFAGHYTVTITTRGMNPYKLAIQLLAGQHAVINPVLKPASVTQGIEVHADIVQLTTNDSGTISSTLDNSRINQLPINQRNLYDLVGMTTPGLEADGQRANGLEGQGMEYVADGAPLTNRQLGVLGQASLPDPDAVQEVRVETSNSSAQYATPATAVINTKSGTNQVHGTLFETARNNAIGNARPRTQGYFVPHLVRNEFGASVGGPIVLPHVYHGKDKSFWFFAYERFSLAQGSAENVTVPTVAMRQGDFSGLTNASGIPQELFDPSTTYSSSTCYNPSTKNTMNDASCRTQFNYNGKANTINPALLAPTSKIFYDIVPLPSTADNPSITSNLTTTNPNHTIVPTVTMRFDHVFNDSNRAYLRYTDNLLTSMSLRNSPSNSPATIAADGFPYAASGLSYNPAATYAGALGFTHVFSPTFFSETIYSQQWYNQRTFAGGSPLTNFEQMLGLPNNFGEVGFPGFGDPYTNLNGTQFVYDAAQITFNLDENLTKTIGKNQIQFGGRYRRERIGMLPDEAMDSVGFTNHATGLLDTATGASYGPTPNTGHQEGDLYLGAAASYSVAISPKYAHMHDMEYDAYFQDNFHWTRNLGANIGLRWEAHPAPWVKNYQMNGFDLKNDAQVLAAPLATYIANGFTTQAVINNLENIGVVFETAQQAGFPQKMIRDYNLDFSPRIALAYQLFGGRHGMVLRGGYGRYSFPIPTRNSVKNIFQNVPFTATYSQSYTAAAQSPDGQADYLLRTNKLPVIMGVNSSNVVNTTSQSPILPGVTLWTFAPDYAPTYTTQANATLEKTLWGNSALRVSWQWTHATNLDHPYYYNAHPSGFTYEMNTGVSTPAGGASVIGTSQACQYSSTAQGPYDCSKYSGSSLWQGRDGWSHDNALQVNYQRLFHHGVAYQIFYVWSKPMRLGGNSSRDGLVYTGQAYFGSQPTVGTFTSPYGNYTSGVLPPTRPAGISSYGDWKGLAKWEQYILDSSIPLHHIAFNGLLDLPFGKGKRFFGNSGRLMNEVVGGWQLAGDGNIVTQNFQPADSNWGPTNPIKTYKHKAPITDCSSGVCHKAFLWFNGYTAPTVINASTKGVSGFPTDYVPYQTPIDNTPGTAYYGSNNVLVQLTHGTQVQSYGPGASGASGPANANPFAHTFLNGPIKWTIDTSLFKVMPITERVNVRMNMDVFNTLNMQGYTNPNTTTGIESLLSSANSPRQVQLSLRLTF